MENIYRKPDSSMAMQYNQDLVCKHLKGPYAKYDQLNISWGLVATMRAGPTE